MPLSPRYTALPPSKRFAQPTTRCNMALLAPAAAAAISSSTLRVLTTGVASQFAISIPRTSSTVSTPSATIRNSSRTIANCSPPRRWKRYLSPRRCSCTTRSRRMRWRRASTFSAKSAWCSSRRKFTPCAPCTRSIPSIVVAGDGAGTDVHLGADVGIAEIRQVAGFGPGAHAGLLQLDEVADVGAGFHMVAHPQAGVRAGGDTPLQHRSVDQGEGADLHVVAQLGILNDGAGADAAVLADGGSPENLRERLDDSVYADFDGAIDGDGGAPQFVRQGSRRRGEDRDGHRQRRPAARP